MKQVRAKTIRIKAKAQEKAKVGVKNKVG